jgi:hypothetical protein
VSLPAHIHYIKWVIANQIIFNSQEIPHGRQRTTLKTTTKMTIPPHYTLPEITTFKVEPLSGNAQPIPITKVDAMRMFQDSEFFQEFLRTMFDSSEVKDYQDLLSPKILASEESEHVVKSSKSKTKGDLVTPFYDIDSRTPMGNVDPGVDYQGVTEDYPQPPQVTGLMEANKNSKLINLDEDTELEKDLVNLIDNIDLKHIIENMSSLEEDKIVDDPKVLELLKDKGINEKLANVDDSVLTLLYLSDAEKNDEGLLNLDTLGESSERDDPKSSVSLEGDEGLSIAAEPFNDATYRNKNVSVLHDLLPKDAIYDLLSEAISNATNTAY